MRITVDLDKCQSHGQCVIAAPQVFDLDDEGVLRFVERPDAADFDAVEEAADVCPVQAISIHD